jgi:hypothetical protein
VIVVPKTDDSSDRAEIAKLIGRKRYRIMKNVFGSHEMDKELIDANSK